MPHLRIQGIDWNYEIEGQARLPGIPQIGGQGEPIVFLHGWGGNLRLWSAQAEYFSRQHQVLRIDLPGHGATSWGKMSLRKMAQHLEKVLESLKFQQVNVVGSSTGGLIVLQWFDLFPQRFKHLVFVGALPKFVMSQDYPYGLELHRLKKIDGQLETDYPAIVNIFFRSLFTHQERQSSRDAPACRQAGCNASLRKYRYDSQNLAQFEKNEGFPSKDALQEFLNILEKEDLRGTLQKINQNAIPVQILNGIDDYICSKEAVGYLQRELPHARVQFFKDCGHFPFLTKPLEFNEALEGFLKT